MFVKNLDICGEYNSCALSFPCVYPVCPISFDHAKLYVVGDVLARYYKSLNKQVIFPIGFHYSGLTAHKFYNDLNSSEDNDTKRIFREFYNCSPNVINYLKQSPSNILDYYTLRTIQDFKKLNISADYNEYYTTNTSQYNNFVMAFFNAYKDKDVFVNSENNFQLNYNDEVWKNGVVSWLENVCTIGKQEKKNLLNSLDDLKNGWNILKNEGYGVKWADGRIIDSMHDSELLSLYDIVNHVAKNSSEFSYDDMIELFSVVSREKKSTENKKVLQVLTWLPTSMLIMEEHLKVWFIKKMYAETLLFDTKYRTRNFFVLGLGLKDGKRMSSSRGTAVLLQDLLERFGAIKSRMIILMAGGHPSSFYNFDDSVFAFVDKTLKSFKYFIDSSLVEAVSSKELQINELFKDFNYNDLLLITNSNKDLVSFIDRQNKYIESGYFKQCLVEVMNILPKIYKSHTLEKHKLLLIANFYIKILLGVTIVDL